MSFLSARNAQLEEDTADLPTLKEELQSSKKQIDVLLVLLGEKEEELEATLMDMKEVKNMYTAHMEELLDSGKYVHVIQISLHDSCRPQQCTVTLLIDIC